MGRTQPTSDQLRQFVDMEHDGPLVMLNVLKFREQSASGEGSGAEAYGRYGEQATKLVERQGGRLLYFGPVSTTLIGEDTDEYDAVALVEYPSRGAFLDMIGSDEYGQAHENREAGLAYQLLIATSPVGGVLADADTTSPFAP